MSAVHPHLAPATTARSVALFDVASRQGEDIDITLSADLSAVSQRVRGALTRLAEEPLSTDRGQDALQSLQVFQGELARLSKKLDDIETLLRLGGVE